MSRVILLLGVLAGSALARKQGSYKSGNGHTCLDVEPINRGLRDDYCDQPMFITFLPKTEENQLLDNICYTFFPLPDDPNTFQVHESRVFCDGSSDVISTIETDIELGVKRVANPFFTSTYVYFGYAGCDTYLIYQCDNFGGGGENSSSNILGWSPNCHSIGLSCLRKVEEIMRDNCFPEVDYYALPMKLPNRCVTQQQCLNPSVGNQFYKSLGLAGPVGHRYDRPPQRT